MVHRLSYGGPAEAEILKVHVVYPCLSMFILSIWGVLSHGRTPSHPFLFGIFHENHENHPAIGDLPWIGNLLRSNFHFLEKPVTVSAVNRAIGPLPWNCFGGLERVSKNGTEESPINIIVVYREANLQLGGAQLPHLTTRRYFLL